MKTNLPIVALVGQTNVGKSTLLNNLVGYGRAIVAREQHTTRDAVDAVMQVGKYHFRVVDTAGLTRQKTGLPAALTKATDTVLAQAAVIVLVVDRSLAPDQTDRDLVRRLRRLNRPLIVVINKSDKLRQARPLTDFQRLGIEPMVEISAVNRLGLERLLVEITERLPKAVVPQYATMMRVALIGRPNVGKSSLFNAVAATERSVVNAEAGTTRDALYETVRYHNQIVELADTAGLRRPGKIGVGIEKFSAVRAKIAIERSDVCWLLLDASDLGTKQDQALAGQIIDQGRGLIIVVHKADLLERSASEKARVLAQLRAEFAFAWWAPVVLVSAKTGQNLGKLLELSIQIHQVRKQKISTPALNRFLADLTTHHPPANAGRGRLRLRYITQTDTNPPTFTLFGNRPSQVHYSYRRYIENQLRDHFDFTGTPIKLVFKDKTPV